MSRPKTIVAPEHLDLLKEKLQQTYGKPIKHSVHCEHLSVHIMQVLHENISAQTLRRIFGFIQSPFTPSITNLDILARYCGYSHWHQLLQAGNPGSFQPLSSTDEAELYLSFYSIDLKDEEDINYHNACRNIAERILTNPTLFAHLASPLAQHPTSQVFFYERFPYIDGLGGDYVRGLRLYLQYKKDSQAQLFAHSLLLLGSVLTQNHNLAHQHYQVLQQATLQNSYHPFVVARVLGSRILYKHCVSNESIESEQRELFKWNSYFSSPTKIQFWVFPYYQFMVSDYLNLAGLYELSVPILNTIPKRKYLPWQSEASYLEAFVIIQAIANSHQEPAAFLNWKQQYKGWATLRVLFHHFYRLQVLTAFLALNKRTTRQSRLLQKEFEDLVHTTGFTFFQAKLQVKTK